MTKLYWQSVAELKTTNNPKLTLRECESNVIMIIVKTKAYSLIGLIFARKRKEQRHMRDIQHAKLMLTVWVWMVN